MIHNFLFFQHGADALQFSNLFGVVEQDAIGTDVEVILNSVRSIRGLSCVSSQPLSF